MSIPFARCAPVSSSQLSALVWPDPRYTAYPTTDRFVEAHTSKQLTQALQLRRANVATTAIPLSVYIHIPFCESLCYFCACNKNVTRDHGLARKYLAYLGRETDLYADFLGAGQPVSQLHLGGGTPTFLSNQELAALVAKLGAVFNLAKGGEFTIEVDPRSVNASRLRVLASLGFNHLRIGIQDTDAAVLKAVHRAQPAAGLVDLVSASRDLGFESVTLDLMYGLPFQSPDSFARTLEAALEARPDRIALYAYAHMPERFKSQRRLSAGTLPGATARMAQLLQSISKLIDAGYEHLGMHQFALPGDALAIAKRQGRLHCNFHGYSALPDGDLLGLGVSSTGRMGASCSQNTIILSDYCDRLERGHLPVMSGLAMSRDDLLRRAVIMAVMCHGQLDFESIELAFLIDFRKYFGAELESLQNMEELGVVSVDRDGFSLTQAGWYVASAVAMVFDRHQREDQKRAAFSRVL